MSDPISENNNKGFKVKIKQNGRSNFKKPLFCPVESCRQISSNLDDLYFEQFGCCGQCYVLYVEGRKVPQIDTELLKNRLKQRGY